jgi:Tfp pilus assembly PilM family ATPase
MQLRGAGDACRVERTAVWQRDVEAEQDTGPQLIDRLTRMREQMGFRGKEIAACLEPPGVEHHILEIPAAAANDPESLEKAARFEIQRLSTMDPEDLRCAAWPMPHSVRRRCGGVGVAVAGRLVTEALGRFNEAGLECVRLNISSCALAEFVWLGRGCPEGEVWGVLDVGASQVRLAICMEDTPVLVRSFAMGGDAWTARISTALKVSLKSAERCKQDIGLGVEPGAEAPLLRPRDGGPLEALRPEELASRSLGALREDLDELCMEVERSYEYVLQWDGKRSPGDLVLVGGGARFYGLGSVLSRRLGIPVEPLSHYDTAMVGRITSALGGHDIESCALACALSLQGTE